MSYVDSSLLQGEEVRYRAKLHWMQWVPYILLTLVSAGVLFPLLVFPWVRGWSTEMAVTNKRVIMKTGLLSRRTLEMNLSKVETIQIEQGITGRIFGFGTLAVVGTGGTRESFAWVAEPIVFRRQVSELAAT